MSLKDELNRKEKHYKELLGYIESWQGYDIEGHLQINRNKSHPQYYWRRKDNGDTWEKEYLRPDQENIKKQLAQKHYYKSLAYRLRRNLKRIQMLNQDYEDDEVDEIYRNLIPERQALVEPVDLLPEQKLANWKARPYRSLRLDENASHHTKNGEFVRSKTEKILADIFFDRGIVYKYECPLLLSDGRMFIPDFTFYNPKREYEIYWEHFGKMDDLSYVINTLIKLRSYEAEGIYLGHRLLVSFEWSKHSLSYQHVERMVNQYLIHL